MAVKKKRVVSSAVIQHGQHERGVMDPPVAVPPKPAWTDQDRAVERSVRRQVKGVATFKKTDLANGEKGYPYSGLLRDGTKLGVIVREEYVDGRPELCLVLFDGHVQKNKLRVLASDWEDAPSPVVEIAPASAPATKQIRVINSELLDSEIERELRKVFSRGEEIEEFADRWQVRTGLGELIDVFVRTAGVGLSSAGPLARVECRLTFKKGGFPYMKERVFQFPNRDE